MSDWRFVEDHSFVGMAVVATTSEGCEVDGEIAGIWEIDGDPRRVDVVHADGLLNVDRDRVEVGA